MLDDIIEHMKVKKDMKEKENGKTSGLGGQ